MSNIKLTPETNIFSKLLGEPEKDDFIEVRPLIDKIIDEYDGIDKFKTNSNSLWNTASEVYDKQMCARLCIHILSMTQHLHYKAVIKLLND